MSKNPFSKKKFDEIVLRSIDSSLREMFGEVSAELILQHIEMNSIDDQTLPKRAEVFSTTLRILIGPGSIFIERSILEDLYSTLELEFKEKEGYKFSDYIDELETISQKCLVPP